MHRSDWPRRCRRRGFFCLWIKLYQKFKRNKRRNKMDPKTSFILWILMFELQQRGGSAAPPEVKTVREGAPVEISCRVPDSGPYVVWFRVLDGSGLEYVASVSSLNPTVKKQGANFPSFSSKNISSHILVLRAFTSADAGVYSCVSQYKDMKFGPVTRLVQEPTGGAAPTEKTISSRRTEPPPEPCVCPTPPAAVDPTHCSTLILAPLAGGCGLLLLILLCTVLYCNSVRTRRCPHHYKRKPRAAAPGKMLKTNTNF